MNRPQTTDHRPPTPLEDGGSKIEDRFSDASTEPSSILHPLSSNPSVVGRRLSVVTPERLLALCVVLYTLAFTAAAWYKYDTYQMGFDLGVHEQVLWNTAHGRIAASSPFADTESYLGIDIIPTELLLAPIYGLAPSAHTMLLLQTLALALGAIPAFLIVRDRFGSAWAGLVFALAFMLYLPVEFMNLYEFQIRAFATTFLLCAFYALVRRRFGPFLLWSLLALGCRSEVGLVLAGMGIYTLLDRRPTTDDRRPTTDPDNKVTRRQGDKVTETEDTITLSPLHPITVSGESVVSGRWSVVAFGLLPIVLGLGWFVLCLQVLIPYFRDGAPSLYLSVNYGRLPDGSRWLGDTPGEIFRTLFTRPGFVLQELFLHPARGPMRLRYLLEMFLPFGFLLLLQPRLLLITLPIFGLNLLSQTPNIHASTHYHYQALIIPFMVVGSAYGLHRLLGWLRAGPAARAAAIGGALALALACNIFFGNPFFSLLTRRIDYAHIAAAERLIARVPPDASLTSTVMLGPHAARREGIFFFPGNVIYPAEKIGHGAYLLIDEAELLSTSNQDQRAQRQRLLDALATGGRYQLLARDRGMALWRRIDP